MPPNTGYQAASAGTGRGWAQGGGVSTSGSSDGTAAPTGGFVSNPVTWVIVMGVLVGLAIFFAHRVGKSDEFSNIRGSFYNIFYVTFVAIVGILMLKVVFSKFEVPGLSAAIQSV